MKLVNPYKPSVYQLEPRKRLIWIISLIGCGIYAIIVFIILFILQIPNELMIITIYTYMVIGPLTIYLLWLVFYRWKIKKWPRNKKVFGEPIHYTLLLISIGICVINWAAYWNTGLDSIWLIFASWIYILSDNLLLGTIIYTVGASAITPAFTEEFLKSFPSIIAFFVVLQRDRNLEEKRKGLLGNELGGFLFGLVIGITFEILELIYYLLITISSGGGAFDIYFQVTVRDFSPLHILGGAIGGFAAGRAERLRYERGEEDLPMKIQIINFIKRFLPLWLIPVSIHFLWNSSSVWIYLIILAIDGDILLNLILEMIVIVTLSALCFFILLLLLRCANRITEKTYRCSETGIIVAKEGDICSLFSDKKTDVEPTKKPLDKAFIAQDTEIVCPNCDKVNIRGANFCINCGFQIASYYYCPNCSKANKFGIKFCIHCGFQIQQLKTPQIFPMSNERPSKALLVISLIVTIGFLFYIVLFAILALLIYGIFGFFYLAFQISIEIVAAVVMFYAIITLFKMRKNYNGRKNIWSWYLLIFNLIGIFGLLVIYGILGVIYGIIAFTLGYITLITGLGFLFLAGATLVFIFLLRTILKSDEMLQYQTKN
ncbi:MAG: hypothetical protein EU529_00130 [Promethearchaeota archaeon]|nr:MAG: hypothetical protein EU529_00130 [Candidatus Lokiarchaeota archaeon]